MSSTIVVAYDGSGSAERALAHAVKGAELKKDANVVVAHVLEWSPYSFLTPEEIEERHGRRKQELERAEKAILQPMLERYKSSKVKISTEIKYGHVAEVLIQLAQQLSAEQVVIGRQGQGKLASRLFGSVAGSLAQTCPIPLTIVP